MNVTMRHSTYYDGRKRVQGTTHNVPDEVAHRWIAAGIAEVPAKESKKTTKAVEQ